MDVTIKKLIDETPVIFRDESTLTPLYVPKKIVERDELIVELVKNLRKLARGQIPHHMLILGSNGSGKTVTVRYVMDQIGEVAMNFYYIHLYGSDEAPLYKTLRNIADDTNCMISAKDVSWAAVYDEFAESLSLQKRPLVIVFDEFDYFISGSMFKLLKKLTRDPNITIIGISNDYNILDIVDDPSFLSVFNPQRVEFTEYTGPELETILTERAKEALFPNTYDDVVIPLIAAMALQNRSGDARYALDLLKYAADNCTDDNRQRITETDVRKSIERLELVYNVSIVTRLPTPLKQVVAQIVRKDEMQRNEVLNQYNNVSKKFGSKTISRTKFSFYLRTLERKGIIERFERGSGRAKGVQRFVRLSPNLDIIEMREVLTEFET